MGMYTKKCMYCRKRSYVKDLRSTGLLNPKYYHPECAEIAAADKRGTAATSQPPTVTPSIPEQIQKLAELRDAGILNEEEFAAKKAGLLSRM